MPNPTPYYITKSHETSFFKNQLILSIYCRAACFDMLTKNIYDELEECWK